MAESDLERRLAFDLRVMKIPHVREYRFTPNRTWRFDFVIGTPEVGTFAVEVEGGIFSGGRHTRGSGFQRDLEKYNRASAIGWRVLRFSGQDVKSGRALDEIEALWCEMQGVPRSPRLARGGSSIPASPKGAQPHGEG